MAAVATRAGLTVLPFAADELGLYAKPLNADGSVAPLTAVEALADSGARAVLDGPMFELCGPVAGATQVEQYQRATCAKLQYLHLDAGRGLSFAGAPSTLGRGRVLAVTAAGAPLWLSAGDRADAARTLDLRVAVQLYPTMVAGGAAAPQSTAGSNGSAEWRAAIGVLDDGGLAFAVGAFSMADFAARLVRAGFVDAGYTDGGGSTRIELASGERFGAAENRRVASWITVGAGGGLGGGLLVGLAAVAAYWWWARRSR